MKFSVLILWNFQWQNCSIFINSCILVLKVMRQPQCTHTHGGLPRVWRVRWGHCRLRDLNMTNNKQPSLIDGSLCLTHRWSSLPLICLENYIHLGSWWTHLVLNDGKTHELGKFGDIWGQIQLPPHPRPHIYYLIYNLTPET